MIPMTFEQLDVRVRELASSRWAIAVVLFIGWGPILVISLLGPVLVHFWNHDELAGLGFGSAFVLGPISTIVAITMAVRRWMS